MSWPSKDPRDYETRGLWNGLPDPPWWTPLLTTVVFAVLSIRVLTRQDSDAVLGVLAAAGAVIGVLHALIAYRRQRRRRLTASR